MSDLPIFVFLLFINSYISTAMKR